MAEKFWSVFNRRDRAWNGLLNTKDAAAQICFEEWDTPGLKKFKVYELICEFEERTDCFCCSCGDRDGSDVACRNHGWAAKRPCDKHDMPGTPWGEETCDDIELHNLMPAGTEHRIACSMGKMPSSVQEANHGG